MRKEIFAKNIAKNFEGENLVVEVRIKRMSARLVVGCMTGTSLDGLDCSLLLVNGNSIDAMSCNVMSTISLPFPTKLQQSLRDFSCQVPMTSKDICQLASDFTDFHITGIRQLLSNKAEHMIVDLIAVHGQTVFHCPPLSWQLFTPARLVKEFGTKVVCDLRAMDLAYGGNGAPITPLADYIVFRDKSGSKSRAIVNLGGFINITFLSKPNTVDSISGKDVCACNQVLDLIARQRLHQNYDEDGSAALKGSVDEEIVQYFQGLLEKQAINRSLGSNDEPREWLEGLDHVPTNDLCRSAVKAIVNIINQNTAHVDEVILAGGGVFNKALVADLKELHGHVHLSDHFGVNPVYRECIEIAILGALCDDKIPITLPQVTGCDDIKLISGSWMYPPVAKTKRQVTQVVDRGSASTEQRNSRSLGIHKKSVSEIVEIIYEEDKNSLSTAFKNSMPAITRFIAAAEEGFVNGGRLIYLGAGTSGRLGVLDASEAPPTFNVASNKVIGIIAGGDGALRLSSEGAEDDSNGCIDALMKLGVNSQDTVLGIAASGHTPYVRGALDYLERLEAPPVLGLLCCSDAAAAADSKLHVMFMDVGPEIVTGSTRMKAGTITKMVLNTISTTLMIRAGKIFDNLMIDVKASNNKLMDRAIRIIMAITAMEREDAQTLLVESGYNCKIAVIMAKFQCGREEAEAMNGANKGVIAYF